MRKIKEKLKVADKIEEKGLKDKVFECWKLALERGKLNQEDLFDLPFTLIIEDCPVNLLEHTVAVTRIAMKSAEIMLAEQIESYELNMDYLIAGGLLHDVGKVLEYKKADGEIVTSDYGELVRHPFSGAALANEVGVPPEVVNMIANHSHEGEENYRCKEAIILNHADFIYFETLKSDKE